MKTYAVLVLSLFLLSGCSGSPTELEIGMELRSKILQAASCSFEADVTADYGDQLHNFRMRCTSDSKGDLSFIIEQPDTISGISGKLTGEGGTLIFDETALHFGLLAEDQLSPVSAPWILMKTLRNGYLSSGCTEEGRVRISIDDSFNETPLRLDIWLNTDNKPEHADILYDGRRILTVDVENFDFL